MSDKKYDEYPVDAQSQEAEHARARLAFERAHVGLCPARKVHRREKVEAPERIRVVLTLSCRHGSTRDFGAVRRWVRGTLSVSMERAVVAAEEFMRQDFVRCLACGPASADSNAAKYRVP